MKHALLGLLLLYPLEGWVSGSNAGTATSADKKFAVIYGNRTRYDFANDADRAAHQSHFEENARKAEALLKALAPALDAIRKRHAASLLPLDRIPDARLYAASGEELAECRREKKKCVVTFDVRPGLVAVQAGFARVPSDEDLKATEARLARAYAESGIQ